MDKQIKLSFDAPVLNVDLELQRLQEEQNTHPIDLRKLEEDHKEMMRKLQEEFYQKKQEMMDRQRERIQRLRDLEKLKAEQTESEQFAETAKIVIEICQEFDAWSHAHDYQVEDIVMSVHAYLQGKTGMLNANDLGLGKTFESIVTLYILTSLFEKDHGRKPYILWLTKTAILTTGSTVSEIRRWWPDFKIAPLKGSDPKSSRKFVFGLVEQTGMAIITNYETIRTTEEAKAIQWDFVVMDEVHKLKGGANVSGPTAIWESVKEVCTRARFNLMLSGTPMVNRPQEMWSYLHIFSPERFKSLRDFENAFCDYRELAGVYQLAVNPEKILENALKGQMIRRRRDEVGLQLPELTYVGDEVTLGDYQTSYKAVLLQHNPEQRRVYEEMRKNFFVWLDEQQTSVLSATAIIAQLTRLRQINVWPCGIKLKDENKRVVAQLDVADSAKIDEAMDIIEAAHDQVVLFSTFNEPMNEIQRRCQEVISERGVGLVCKIISGETANQMDGIEKEFQDGKIDVLCINSAMGEGLNLQKNPEHWSGGSAIGIFLDIWWNPARNEQCEGRIYRQGANQPVTIYRLMVENSVDYFMLDKVIQKDAQFSSIMESEEVRPPSDWKNYLKGLI
jgi:SNF2 family DNA or RNA helicase